jgi:hypothetical protein
MTPEKNGSRESLNICKRQGGNPCSHSRCLTILLQWLSMTMTCHLFFLHIIWSTFGAPLSLYLIIFWRHLYMAWSGRFYIRCNVLSSFQLCLFSPLIRTTIDAYVLSRSFLYAISQQRGILDDEMGKYCRWHYYCMSHIEKVDNLLSTIFVWYFKIPFGL